MKYSCFFIKVERTQEEAKQVCLSMFQEGIQLWVDTLNDNNKGIPNLYNYTNEECLHHISVFERLIRVVENNYCQRAVWNRQTPYSNSSVYIDGKGLYIEDREVAIVFSTDNDTNERLFSLEECLLFIHNPKNKCIYDDNIIDLLVEFWHEFPNSFIEFN